MIDILGSNDPEKLRNEIKRLDSDIDWRAAVAHGLFNGAVIGTAFLLGGTAYGVIIAGVAVVTEIRASSNNRAFRVIHNEKLEKAITTIPKPTQQDLAEQGLDLFNEPGVIH